jgi:hypothetical protein
LVKSGGNRVANFDLFVQRACKGWIRDDWNAGFCCLASNSVP